MLAENTHSHLGLKWVCISTECTILVVCFVFCLDCEKDRTWIDLSGDSVCWSYAEISLVLGDAYSYTVLVSDIWFAMCYDGWLHFMWGVAEAKCILVMHVCVSVNCSITFCVRHSSGEMYCVLVTCVCVSVPHGISTLLHGPGCNLGEWQGVPSSYAVLGKFAIGARAMTT